MRRVSNVVVLGKCINMMAASLTISESEKCGKVNVRSEEAFLASWLLGNSIPINIGRILLDSPIIYKEFH